MKNLFLLLFLSASTLSFAQNDHTGDKMGSRHKSAIQAKTLGLYLELDDRQIKSVKEAFESYYAHDFSAEVSLTGGDPEKRIKYLDAHLKLMRDLRSSMDEDSYQKWKSLRSKQFDHTYSGLGTNTGQAVSAF